MPPVFHWWCLLRLLTTRVNETLDRFVEGGSNDQEIQICFQMRVEDYFCQAGGIFGGKGLDNLPQHDQITQDQYNQLYAAAAGLAAVIYREAGYEDLANQAATRYGLLREKLDF